MTLGDRIAVHVRRRASSSSGRPQEVYDRPANLFVAGFIGSPPMNLLRRRSVRWACSRPARSRCRCPGVPDGEVVLGVRPERLAPGGRRRRPPALDFRSRSSSRWGAR